MDIIKEIKESFKVGSYLTKLIYINIAIFVIVNIIDVVFYLANASVSNVFSVTWWLSVPADTHQLIYRPWTIITYMFLHHEFMHILFNMLWLFWFGKIFLEFLDQKKLLSVYLLGGISGGLLYVLAFNVFPVFKPFVANSVALGASASVIAIVTAISFYVPDYTVMLMFIGRVKLKYIAIVTIFLDVLSIASGNAGGHIAHIGGAIFGYAFIANYKKGKVITKGFESFLDSLFTIFKPRPKVKVTYKKPPTSDIEYNAAKVQNQAEIDRILEKISKSGYDSLSKDEKDKLFKMSK